MENNKIITFLRNHWSKLFFGLALLVCCTIWGERLFNSKRPPATQDYLAASQIFERFKKGEYLPNESIEMTEAVLKRHPELHSKYDSMLAATFFCQNNAAKGLLYAKSALKHAGKELPSLYADYARTTFLIADQNYSEALNEAQTLDQALSLQQGYDFLAASNLLRIAFLAEVNKEPLIQKQAWERLKQHKAFSRLEPCFQAGKLGIRDYIPKAIE